MYFPFEEGAETIPFPSHMKQSVTDEDSLKLVSRTPTAEVRWNERLIKEAWIPLLGFGFIRKGATFENQKLDDKVPSLPYPNSIYSG